LDREIGRIGFFLLTKIQEGRGFCLLPEKQERKVSFVWQRNRTEEVLCSARETIRK
jgi:hypothetical protein